MPAGTETSVNVPSPLLRYRLTEPGGRPRGPQFTGIPFHVQLALPPGGGTDLKSNRSAIGARVTAHYGGKKQTQEVLSQASFYSANDLRLHFGLGAADNTTLEIRWPNGGREQIASVSANQLLTIREGGGIVRAQRFR